MHPSGQTTLNSSNGAPAAGMWPFYQKVLGAGSHQELFNTVTRLLVEALPAEASAVVLTEKESDEMFIPAAWSADAEIRGQLLATRFADAKTAPCALFPLDGPSLVTDFGNTAEGSPKDPLLFDRAVNRMTVPLLTDETAIGILWVINKSDGAFTERDMKLGCAVAAITVLGMEAISLRGQICRSDQSAAAFDLAKTRITHRLSHALKTPLAVLSACVKLLERHLADLPDKRWRTISDRAHRNLDRLLAVEYEVEDILRQAEGDPYASAAPMPEKVSRNEEEGAGETNVAFPPHRFNPTDTDES